MFRFLSSESKSLVGAASLVGLLSFASRFFGFIRDRILSSTFGAGDTLDAYMAAFKIPDVLYQLLVVGALSASFIPLFTGYLANKEPEKAWRFVNNALHLLVAAFFVGIVLAFLFIDPLVTIIAPGFSPEKLQLVKSMSQVMLIASFCLSISMVFGSVLQGTKRFFFYGLAPIFYNIGIMAGAVFFVPQVGPIGLAFGVLCGALLHLGLQIFGALFAGYKYVFVWKPFASDIRELFSLTIPRMLGIGIAQIDSIILTQLASYLVSGSLTILQFAQNIQFLPIGVIGVSYAIAVFPTLSEHASTNDKEAFVESWSTAVRQMLFWLVPAMVLFLILRAQIVRVVVGSSAFTWDDTIRTAQALGFFTLSMIPQSLIYLLSRGFYAFKDTWTPLVSGVVAIVLELALAFLLLHSMGVAGLAIAFSVAMTANMALLWVGLRQKVGHLDERRLGRSLLTLLTAGFFAGVAMQSLKVPLAGLFALTTFAGVLIQGLVAGSVGLCVYVLMAFLFRSEEAYAFFASLRKRIFKKVVPEEPIGTEGGSM